MFVMKKQTGTTKKITTIDTARSLTEVERQRMQELQGIRPADNIAQRLLEKAGGGVRPGERSVDARRRGARRAGKIAVSAVGGVTAIAVTVGAGKASMDYLKNAEDAEPTRYGYVQVGNGDNGTTLGRELGEGNENINRIATEIQDQAGEDGYLQPGQIVKVNLDYVDHPDMLLDDYDPSVEPRQ